MRKRLGAVCSTYSCSIMHAQFIVVNVLQLDIHWLFYQGQFDMIKSHFFLMFDLRRKNHLLKSLVSHTMRDWCQFLHRFRTGKADRSGRLLDPYPINPPLSTSRCWTHLPRHHYSRHTIGNKCTSDFGAICPLWGAPVPLCKHQETVNFVSSMSGCN